MREIAIEGTKGAGKTTALAAARDALGASGLTVATHAPFARGNARYRGPGGLFARWGEAESAREAMAWLLADTKAAVEAAARGGADVLLHDRHWITALRAMEDSALPPDEAQALAILWRVIAPPTVFLHCDPSVTLERRAGELDARSGLWSPGLVRRDHELRLRIAASARDVIMLRSPDCGADDVAAAVVDLCRPATPSPLG